MLLLALFAVIALPYRSKVYAEIASIYKTKREIAVSLYWFRRALTADTNNAKEIYNETLKEIEQDEKFDYATARFGIFAVLFN